jgi:hypothetical protein
MIHTNAILTDTKKQNGDNNTSHKRRLYDSKVSKGKSANSTERRRFVWEQVIWPLVLDTNRSYFTFEQYHNKCDQVCKFYGVPRSKLAGGLSSLTHRGLVEREQTTQRFSLPHHLTPYLASKVILEYGVASKKMCSKK